MLVLAWGVLAAVVVAGLVVGLRSVLGPLLDLARGAL
ncbi:hypothetical protein CLV37_10991 [Kineococcus rhizosphaerae]|uniref:Uncharacterized protein n=1 Tax=Kineococcus rhizosphaerae TaxID=559628 RepID=A0A2T0R0T2_9ACTN|nr:hypothetical protein CLV37_10991 [Kineococcus rhizosphaerae]